MRKMLLCALFMALFCGFSVNAQAAEANEQDVAKVTCKAFLEDKEGIPATIMWLDGYLSALSDNTVMSMEWLEKLTTHMMTYCGQNPDKTLMDAVDALPE